ncbi:MAG: hypothetical protein ABWY55_03175 [Microbacterium sp.]
MIVAGLILLSVGIADLVRQFVPAAQRWIGLLVAGILIIAIGALSDAVLASLLAVAVAGAWMWLMPSGKPARAAFWPAVALAAVCGGLVALLGARAETGLIGEVWHLPSPLGDVPFDLAVLVIGTIAFLLESANVVVRAALDVEMPARKSAMATDVILESDPAESEAEAQPATEADQRDAVPLTVEPELKGGRLIGPLERVIVFAMMLAGAYVLVAAVFAAKGIVRFPEISRDDGSGSRAEYFLVGSMVSWGLALAGALLVWWGTAGP